MGLMRLYHEVGRAASPEGWTGLDDPGPEWSWLDWAGQSGARVVLAGLGWTIWGQGGLGGRASPGLLSVLTMRQLASCRAETESRGACVAWARGGTLSCPRRPGLTKLCSP